MEVARCRDVVILCWNVRGLGDPVKCSVVRSAIVDAAPRLLLLQETKLTSPSPVKLRSFLPACLDAAGASGGILTAWDPAFFSLAGSSSGRFSLTVHLDSAVDDLSVSITNVYGPCVGELRDEFLLELEGIAGAAAGVGRRSMLVSLSLSTTWWIVSSFKNFL